MTKLKWQRLVLLTTLFLLGLGVSYFGRLTYWQSLLAVYALPVILNFLWLQRARLKVLVFSLATTIIFAVPVELLSRLADSWDVASSFPRLFGIVPIENLVYAFLNFLWVLSFYEYFFDHDTGRRFSSRAKYLLGLYVVLFVIAMTIFLFLSQQIIFHYWLIALMIIFIPLLLLSFLTDFKWRSFIVPTIFFAFIFFSHEIISLRLGYWWWPGEYLWPITLFGQTFPIDDVIIWHLASTPALLSGYKYFIDTKNYK